MVKGATRSASSALNTAAQPIATQRTGPSPGGALPSRSSAVRIAPTPPASGECGLLPCCLVQGEPTPTASANIVSLEPERCSFGALFASLQGS